MGDEGRNGPERRLGGVFFSFRVFNILTNFFVVFRIYLRFTRAGRFGWAARTQTSPNGASGVVGGLGMFFFHFLLCFLYTN
jgi:hypothetical protein